VTLACLALVLAGLAVSLPVTALARGLGRRVGALDSPGVPGQVKEARRPVPNTGGVGIFWGVFLPIGAALVALHTGALDAWAGTHLPELAVHLPGLRERTPDALVLLGGALVLHVLGLIDDRKALGAFVKLPVMLGVAAAVVRLTDTRLLTLLDGHVGGPWASILVSVLWIGVVTNAMNFLDNMDGLSGGVGLIAAALLMASTLGAGVPQWFVAGTLALLVGSLAGFLVFNAPVPWRRAGAGAGGGGGGGGDATIFMGDGGSLVVGFLLAVLTARLTYFDPGHGGAAGAQGGTHWYGVLMPVVVLAVPLYDFAVVSGLRLRSGKSPFVGDLNHLSHRLVRRGLSKRDAVYVIWGLTLATAIGGVFLARLEGWQAALVGVQTGAVLGVLALLEFGPEARR
jgi:UDP-GlcNAc:undecaprenyl-phosphate GlcNAc-1-phosphate transferase